MTPEERDEQIKKDARKCEIEQEIYDKMKSLSDSRSCIGDWKIIKCYEAKLKGEELPYDLDELMTQRQAVRDEINELQKELEALNEQ